MNGDFESRLELELVAAAERLSAKPTWRWAGAALPQRRLVAAAAALALLLVLLFATRDAGDGGGGGATHRPKVAEPPAPAPQVVARGRAPHGEWVMTAVACANGDVALAIGDGARGACATPRKLTVARERKLGTTFVYGTTGPRVDSVKVDAGRRPVRVRVRTRPVRGRDVSFYVAQVSHPVARASATAFSHGRAVECVPASSCERRPAGGGRQAQVPQPHHAPARGRGGGGGREAPRSSTPRAKQPGPADFVRVHPASDPATLASDASTRTPWSLTAYACGDLAPGHLILTAHDGSASYGQACRWQHGGPPAPLSVGYVYLRGAQRTLVYGAGQPSVTQVRLRIEGAAPHTIATTRPTAAQVKGTGLPRDFAYFVFALPGTQRLESVAAPGLRCARAYQDRTSRARERTPSSKDPERRFACR